MYKFKTRTTKPGTQEEQAIVGTALPHRGLMAIAVVGMAIGLAASSAISGEDRLTSSNSALATPFNSADSKHEGEVSVLTDNTADSDSISAFEVSLPADSTEIEWFNNRPIRQSRILKMKVTAYSPDEKSCGKHADGITASGYSVWTNGMKLVAADTDLLPFGTLLSIPGYENAKAVPVLDRGSAIKGNRLDVLFPTHEAALEWGVRELEVTVWEYVDGEQDDFKENHH